MKISRVASFYCSCGHFNTICVDEETNESKYGEICDKCGIKYNAKIENIPNGQAVYIWEEEHENQG